MPTFDALYSEVEAEESKFDSLFSDVDKEEKEQTAANVQKFGVEQPMQAVSALQSALPVGLGVQNRLQRKEALQEATQEARTAGKVGRFVQGAVETAEQAAEALSPSGLMNQPARLLGKPDVYQPGQPLLRAPRIPGLEGSAAGGAQNVILGAVESMTTPEMIVTAPAMAVSALARGAMAFDMARHIPEQVAQSAQTLATPESTAQEKVEAIGGPLLGAFFAGALARGHVARPKEIPLQTGKAIERPAGAQAPRIEPPPGIERATPEQSAAAARRMQRTATAAYEAPKTPRATVPEGPIEELGPVVTETPEVTRQIQTWDDAVLALRERAKGTETREQIQALLPEIQISREGAASLAREVFGENWKPGGAERAPGPKPVEGLTPEQQAILDKGRTTTMSAEERALADRMMAGELDRPSEAQQAPVVERPNERIEVQRQGKEEGQGAIAQPEPALAAQEPTPAPSPMPEAAKAPEPVQPAPLTASMESARAVLAMTPAEFAQRARSFNKTNLELGRKVSDAELAELEGMAAKADERWQQAKARAQKEKTPEAMDEMMSLSSMPQYFNEAISEARKARQEAKPATVEPKIETIEPKTETGAPFPATEAPKPEPAAKVTPSKPAESPLNAKVASLKSQLENVSAQYEEARNASLTAETTEATREAREKAEELKYQKTELERQLGYAQGDAVIENWRAERKAMPAEAPSGTVKVTPKELKAQKENLSEQVNNAIKNPPQGQTVLFEVPGDGSFKIQNTPEALKTFKNEVVKAFPTTAPTPPVNSRLSTPKPSSPAQVKETLKPEELRTVAKDFLSTDPDRKAITYAYADGTQIVATDGRRMIRIVTDKAPGSPLEPVRIDAAGKIVPSGEAGRYPSYEQVIPTNPELVFGGADSGQLFHIAKQAKVFADTMPPTKGERVVGVRIMINKDRSLGASMKIEGDEFAHNVQPDAYEAGAYNPDYLVDALNAMRRLGSEKVDLLVSGDTGPMVIRGRNAEAVIMPVNLSTTGGIDIRHSPSKAMRTAGKAEHSSLPTPLGAIETAEGPRTIPLGKMGDRSYFADISRTEIVPGVVSVGYKGKEITRRFDPIDANAKGLKERLQEFAAKEVPEKDRAFFIKKIKEAIKQAEAERSEAAAALEKRRTMLKEKAVEPIGMGGAVPKEFEKPSGSPTAMKYADIDADRIKRGLEPLTKPEGLSDQQAMDKAFAALDADPLAGQKLVDSLLENPRVIEDWQNHLLLLHRIDIRQERLKSAARARQAYEDSKQFPNRLADVAEANAETQRWSDQLDRIERASRMSGSARGRALRSLQVMANEDYSLESMQMRALEARNFRELSPEDAAKENAELKKLADEHKAKAEALQKRLEDLEAEVIMKAAKEAPRTPEYHPRVLEMAENYARKWDERGKKALDELKALMGGKGQMFSGAPFGPEVLDKLAIYGISKMVRGAVDLAKWTDAMVKDLGEGFRQHANLVWDEANSRLDRDLKASESKFGKDAPAVKTAVKAGTTKPTVTPENIIGRMTAKRAKNPKADIGTLARQLSRFYIEQGIKDRNQLLDRLHEDLQKVDPTITRRGTMEILSGYGDYSRLPQDTVSVTLRDLQGQMQQILKLEDMAAGKAPPRTGRERRVPSDVERRLVQQVEEAKRKGGYTVTDPATQLRTALDAVKKRLENQIADLELQIKTRTKIVKDKTPIQEDTQTQNLRTRRDELKAQYDEIFSPPELTDAQRLQAWKERTRERINEMQEVLAGTKARKTRKAAIEMDHEALRLRYDLHQIERQIREREVAEKMKNRPTYQKVLGEVGETANTVRALMTSFDFSAPLRQGFIASLSHPVRSARAVPEMFKAAMSPLEAFKQAEQLRNRDNAPLYESSGLYLAEHGGRLSAMEEAFMSRRAEKLPIVGRGIRASQRAYTSYLNRIRADSFDAMAKSLTLDGKGNPEELKAIANFINVATGRGSVAWNQAATTLNTVFFAPRYLASRFEFLAGQPLYKGSARTRKLIAKEYGRFLAGAAAVYALAQAAGGKVGTDPNSADFGKINVGGTRIDPMAGLLQTAVFGSRVGSIYGAKLGINKPPEQKGQKLKLDKVLWNFVRGKFAPVPGLVVSIGVGKYPGGKKVTPGNVATSVIPISWQDILEATKAQGVPTGIALGVLSIFGAGVQTYEK